ncbi:MAG: cation-translocating P-type ATPase [Lachnospiraceae bacterium]|nr:cation-translocating P-type ATPase [Lachnospiraceae bacterium]
MKNAYQKTIQELFDEFNTGDAGLSGEEAARRLERCGANELQAEKKTPLILVFAKQFQDLLVLILIAAAVISWISGNEESTLVIFAVIILNALLGTIQQQKAQKSLDSLKAMSAPHARLLRDHEKTDVPAAQIVPGDILLLEAGDIVAADGRILNCYSLQVNESSLTGESAGVEKQDGALKQELPLADRTNMVYSGSLVTYGRAKVLVTATGMQTEIGKIASLMNASKARKTPLQTALDHFSKRLAAVILAICLVVFLLGIFRDMTVLDSLLFAVALAVAAIPEALSSIVTIVQALGTQKMAKEHAILKDLKAVETLGCVSVICSDKTGTLTQNRMTVRQVYTGGALLSPDELDLKNPLHRLLLYDAVLANDSVLTPSDAPALTQSAMFTNIDPDASGIGDPTEYCLLQMARQAKVDETVLRDMMPRLQEIPFDSVRKLMSVKCMLHASPAFFVKGAVDELLSRTTHTAVLRGQTDRGGDGSFGGEAQSRDSLSGASARLEIRPLTEADKAAIIRQNEAFSQAGLRVLAFAYRELSEDKDLTADSERGLCFLGLVSIIDPPRPESAQAVSQAKKAGIRPVMITGDHKITAAAIAKQIGMLEEGGLAITGNELDQMSDDELSSKIEQISVYARVSPENKIRIVESWQKKGHIVAMTGDGVNDAPALKKSDIGVAMGITGTDVSKDAASMILTDDNFATIIKAVANGRNVYKNIRNAVLFLLSGNTAAIMAVLFTSVAALPVPFMPVQLLFINLITDSLPAIAIGMEQDSADLLSEKPRGQGEPLLNAPLYRRLLAQGFLIAASTLAAYGIGLRESPTAACTMAFSTLTAARLFHGFNCRSGQSIFRIGLCSNKYSLAAFACGMALLAAVLLLPPLQPLFSVTTLGGSRLASVFLLALLPTALIQAKRLLTEKASVSQII